MEITNKKQKVNTATKDTVNLDRLEQALTAFKNKFGQEMVQAFFDMACMPKEMKIFYENDFEGYSGPSKYFYEKFGIVSTWQKMDGGTVLRAASDNNTGGSDNVVLTKAQLARHQHTYNHDDYWVRPNVFRGESLQPTTAQITDHFLSFSPNTAYCGEDAPHNNLPHYQNCHVYRRTA